MQTTKNLKSFSSINDVAGMLDCGVLEHYSDSSERSQKPLFWLGDEGDGSVGLPSFCASPTFNSLAELDRFCSDNLEAYKLAADQIDSTGSLPDNWFWQERNQYKSEFPDFGEMDVAIPPGFVDTSWHNDTMPSFQKEQSDGSFLTLWVDYADPEKCEMNRTESPRFTITHEDHNHNGIGTLLETDNYDEVLAKLDSLAPKKTSAARL